jgi:hypothetical protein
MFMSFKLITHLRFFLRIKLKNLIMESKNFTCFNKFMLVWIIILIFLNLFNSLSRLFFSPLNENKLIGIIDKAKAFRDETIDLWMLNAMTPLNDLFTELTFLYLFFHQARMQKRMQGKGMKKSKDKDGRRYSQMHFSDESLL